MEVYYLVAVVTMKQLLEAGVHFGHQTRRWNPKMAPYIYMERNGIYIIDLQQTVKKFEEAYEFIKSIAAEGKTVLFVGTKKQAQEAIEQEAQRCGMFYVNQRWLGGMLTNFSTIRQSIERLKKIEEMEEKGILERLPKKEVMQIKKRKARLEKYLSGIRDMEKLPDALFVVDPRRERNAVLEARKMDIPIIAIVDTNCDPDEIDYPIPGNDDAIRAIRLFSALIADAVLEGKRLASEGQEMIATEGIAIPQEEIEEAEVAEEIEEMEEMEEIVVDNNDNKEEEENVSQEEDALQILEELQDSGLEEIEDKETEKEEDDDNS